jgi:hypothetical protein
MKDRNLDMDLPSANIELLSEAQAADILNMTPRMLADRRRAGKIGSIKDGHVIAYTMQHLADYQRMFQRRGNARAELDTKTLIKVLKDRLNAKW